MRQIEACGFLIQDYNGEHMPPEIRNILADLPSALSGEVSETISATDTLCIERIVSRGQATPEGQWLDQERDEWVLLLTGAAGILFEGDPKTRGLVSGDYLLIPARCRHRVVWTAPDGDTVWLAVHFTSAHRP